MTTVETVTQLVEQLTPEEQAQVASLLARLRDERERALQRERNQAAIALIDSWLSAPDEADDMEGGESWEAMLHDLDRWRFSPRTLFPAPTEEP